jgi:hypothetical protein
MAAGLVIAGAAGLCAQVPVTGPSSGAAKPTAAVSALPAARPTGAAAQAEASAAPAAAEHHAEVSYADGKLAVEATNASLNEILREVSEKTGIKITGGVADDQVFGSYGPSAPALVLDALLDGTGSNILLVNDAKGGSELILTARHGGATPPNPNAGRQTNEASENSGGYVPPVRPFAAPIANGRGQFVGGTGSQLTPPSGGAEPVPAPDSDPAAGGGAKTPQEIYEQLQQSMQQKHAGGTQPQ